MPSIVGVDGAQFLLIDKQSENDLNDLEMALLTPRASLRPERNLNLTGQRCWLANGLGTWVEHPRTVGSTRV